MPTYLICLEANINGRWTGRQMGNNSKYHLFWIFGAFQIPPKVGFWIAEFPGNTFSTQFRSFAACFTILWFTVHFTGHFSPVDTTVSSFTLDTQDRKMIHGWKHTLSILCFLSPASLCNTPPRPCPYSPSANAASCCSATNASSSGSGHWLKSGLGQTSVSTNPRVGVQVALWCIVPACSKRLLGEVKCVVNCRQAVGNCKKKRIKKTRSKSSKWNWINLFWIFEANINLRLILFAFFFLQILHVFWKKWPSPQSEKNMFFFDSDPM